MFVVQFGAFYVVQFKAYSSHKVLMAEVRGVRMWIQQGLQKRSLWNPRGAKTLPKMEANFGFKKSIF